MKLKETVIAEDYTEAEVLEGLNNVWGRGDFTWLWSYVEGSIFIQIVNGLHQIYFNEEKNYSLERIIEDSVMLVTHQNDYKKLIELWV